MNEKIVAESAGTFLLVLFGCGTAVFMGEQVGMLGIAVAFGLAMMAAAYLVGSVSGAHINPAVSLAMHLRGRLTRDELLRYWIAQVVGAIFAAFLIVVIASGSADYSIATNGVGQNGFGAGYLGEYNFFSALVFELVATFVFVLVVLKTTNEDTGLGQLAGLIIGLTLMLIHIAGINITGVSVNPARSIGPALFAGASAIADLWLFILVPLAGAWLAVIVDNGKVTELLSGLVNRKEVKPSEAEGKEVDG